MIGDYCCCGGNPNELTGISELFITVERVNATSPSKSVFLAGKYDEFNRAELTVSDPNALNANLSAASGNFSLYVFTSSTTNYTSGIWFIMQQNGTTIHSLTLPVLSQGWIYEAWIEQNDQVSSLGTFLYPNQTDSNGAGPFAGSNLTQVPNAPGEEWVLQTKNLTNNATVFVTVEPTPDNDPSTPFAITALFNTISNVGPFPASQNIFSFAFSNPHGASEVHLADLYQVQIDLEVVGFELLNDGYEYHVWGKTTSDEIVSVGVFNEEGNKQIQFLVSLPTGDALV